jgi:hypothetical protein
LILTMVPQMRQLVTVWLVLCFSCFTGLHIAWLHEVLFQFMFSLSIEFFYIMHLLIYKKLKLKGNFMELLLRQENVAINICTVGHILSLKRRRMSLLLFITLVFFET